MKSTIQGKEVIEFLEFLHQKDQLHIVLPEIEVPENLVVPYIQYKLTEEQVVQEEIDFDISDEPTKKRKLEDFDRAMKTWTSADLVRLKNLIKQGASITNISSVLDRSPAAVRKKAYYGLKFSYSKNLWVYLGE